MTALVPTPAEMDLIHRYALLMEKFHWLRVHPDKTRRDYQKALHDGSLVEWRKAEYKKSMVAEQAAWERDFPDIRYDDVTTCLAQHHPREAALYDAWKLGRRANATSKCKHV